MWQTSAAGRAVSRGNPEWRREFAAVLRDLTENDICGSGFAITAYTVSDTLGGSVGLAYFRERPARCGIRLMLDVVPNHTAPDHPWMNSHPDYYMEASGEVMSHEPHNHMRAAGQDPRPWARSELPRLARYVAAQLRKPRPACRANRRAGRDRMHVRRRAL